MLFGKIYKFDRKKNKMHKVGGQAVFNGVMMYNRPNMAVAIRKDSKIKVKKFKINLFPNKIQKLFFIRGIFNLMEMLYIGIKALKWSTDEAVEEEEKPSSIWFVLTFLIGIIVALLIFKFIPLLVATGFSKYNDSNFLFNLVDGLMKFGIFLSYIYVISFMDDVKEIFKYHGAEHKVVNCYEDNKDLTIENVQEYKTLNTRCGTSFVLIVILISVIVYMFIPKEFSFLEKFGYRLLLLPLIAGISYEVLRLGDKLKFLSYPGMLIQKITTKEPRNDQVEVAIKVLKEVL